MSKIIMVTGGSRSGKSKFAEEICKKNSDKIAYIATMRIFDEEMQQRVDIHKARRGPNWETFEIPCEIRENMNQIQKFKIVLLDCLTMLIFNKMFSLGIDFENISSEIRTEVENIILEYVEQEIKVMKNSSADFVIVTNEIGLGIIPEYPLSRLYRDIAGKANQILAENSEEVFFVVSGIPVKIKG